MGDEEEKKSLVSATESKSDWKLEFRSEFPFLLLGDVFIRNVHLSELLQLSGLRQRKISKFLFIFLPEHV